MQTISTEQEHPFLTPRPVPDVEEELDNDPILGREVSRKGLQSPPPAAPPPVLDLSAAPIISSKTLWLIGAHGGAGVTTLASLAGQNVVDSAVVDPLWQGKALLVAATHAAGLEAARQFARDAAGGDLFYDLLGIVLVHDQDKLSKARATLAKGVARMYPLAFSVPFEPSWREPGIAPRASSIRLKKTIQRINQLTTR